ncbi:tetratricopeptide repeat protein [Fusobacterium periodonticum]|uniref:Tetratricopeptide repeat protein n=1 Tax=Fusobacterium periodonticum ATCC 33693 TaxID=546275 RepID=D4CTG9_9FUSO|nr:hypothetical protein [Fusobacterium periodonticum]EFE87398.1 tetratricopeptide repeat protein [Fusobacterium periodonticum ATCC 33693]
MDEKFWKKIYSLQENGEFEKIVKEIKNLPEDKLDMKLISVLSRAYINLEDFENALNTNLSFIGKVKEDVTNANIWIYSECGWICNEIRDFEQGLKYLLEAEKLGRDDEWLNTEIGQCLGKLKRAEEGLERLKKALKLIEVEDTENINKKIFINSEIAYLYELLENSEEALNYFYIAKDLGRNDNWIHIHLWINLEKTIGKEEALKYFQNEIKTNDLNSSLWGSLGQIYMDMFANYEEAEKAFKNAFKYSLNTQYLYDRSKALMSLKKYEEAIEILLELREISEQEEELTDVEDIELVRCFIELKDRKNAEKYLEFAKEYMDKYESTLTELENLINKI